MLQKARLSPPRKCPFCPSNSSYAYKTSWGLVRHVLNFHCLDSSLNCTTFPAEVRYIQAYRDGRTKIIQVKDFKEVIRVLKIYLFGELSPSSRLSELEEYVNESREGIN